MIKAGAGELLLLGLSDGNLALLKQGKPIEVNLAEIHNNSEPFKRIVIFWGRTEQDIKKMLEPYITADTRVHGQEN